MITGSEKDTLKIGGGVYRQHHVSDNPIMSIDPLGLCGDPIIQLTDNNSSLDYLASGLGMFGGGLKILSTAVGIVKDASSIAGNINSTPDFIVGSGGTAYPVPEGATGPTPVISPRTGNYTGDAFTGGQGGANGQVSSMRIMNGTDRYPSGYIKYENSGGQGVNPYTGRTGSNSETHFPLN